MTSWPVIRSFLLFSLCFFCFCKIPAQSNFTQDTTSIRNLFNKGNHYIDGPSDSLLHYYQQALSIIQARLKQSDAGISKLNEQQYRLLKNLELRALIEFGIEHFFQSDYPMALEYYFQALAIAEQYADIEDISECYSEIGIVYKNQGNYDLALDYYQQALDFALQTKNKSWIASCNTNIGNVYIQKGYYNVALDYYLTALETFEELGHTRRIAACYENIGEVYQHQKDYEQALFYFDNALKLALESDYKSRMTTCYLNIGKVYTALGIYDYARINFEKSLEVLQTQGYTHELDDCYKGIARTYFLERDLVRASEFYLQALEIAEKEYDKASIAEILESLGSILIRTGNYNGAIDYLQKSLEISLDIGAMQSEMKAYEGLAMAYELKGDLVKSIASYQQYNQMKDSLFSVEKYKAITEMAVKYESKQREQELALLTEQHQVEVLRVSRRNRLILGIAVVFILIILIGYLLFRQKELKARQQSMMLEQKFLRSQMNPHFIFNSLIAIQSFIYKKEPVVAGDYLAKFAELVRMILENSREEFIPFDKEIKTVEYYIELQSLRYENVFDFQIEINKDLDTENIMVPPMFAQPFIENAIEHGLRHLNEKGLLKIEYSAIDTQLVCIVQDNGIGRDRARELEKEKRHNSLATSITRERLQVLSKKYKQAYDLEIEDLKTQAGEAGGTKVLLRIPYIE